MQKRSRGFRTRARSNPLIPLCGEWARGRSTARNAMHGGRTVGHQPSASAKNASRRLRAPQMTRARACSPVHPARRVRRTRHTALHPGRSETPRTIRPCLRCPQRPWLRGGRPPRAPRSAGQHRTAADAGVGGQNLFSSQAGSGTRPAGEASSSGTAPQGRSEADIGKDAARRQQKREGGRSSAERMMFASRGGCGSPSNCGASHGGRAAHLVEETAERLDYGCVREQSSVPIPKQLAHASWGMVANREELYMHVHFQYLHSLVRNEHIARIRRPHMAHNAAPTALLSILRRWLTTLLSHQEACSAPRYTYPRVRASAPRARALAPRRPPW